MTIKAQYVEFCSQLSKTYEAREANNIARIVFEDAFQIRNFERLEEFVETDRLQKILLRLQKNEPIQYILGEADFFGLKFKVDPRVLIPRPETEELVDWIRSAIKKNAAGNRLKILDIGTGSACIPVTLAHFLPENDYLALDIDPELLILAQENALKHAVNVKFKLFDILDEKLWQTLPKFDIIVSNPPYIPKTESKLMPDHVLDFEPHLALFVEDMDALVFYKKIIHFAKDHLAEDGQLFFECNEYNSKTVYDYGLAQDFNQAILKKDMQGKDRMLQFIV